MRRILYILLLLLIIAKISAQEIVTGMQFNPVVRMEYLKNKSLRTKISSDSIPVVLPFYDDFSSNSVFPSSERWIDRDGFQNSDYPIYPIDRGVVTLDAINDSGAMYRNAVPGPQSFLADHLTSRFIRLDSAFNPAPRLITPGDSVYLSFYYQPQGRGIAPHTSDSLVLQFLIDPAHDSTSPTDTNIYHIPDRWKHVWADKGIELDSFYLANNHYFKRVMLPITDTAFFKKEFRFQFYNYVSLASIVIPSWMSNCCQWNIDQVYLNSGRSQGDTVMPEIRFTERAPSLLKTYQSMPYTQFSNNPSNEMIDSLALILTNRDTVSHSSRYSYYVSQPGTSFTKNYQSPPINLQSYTHYAFGYVEHPPIPFTFPISTQDSTEFLIVHEVHGLTPGSPYGDTIMSYQQFYNYYAYDDGTAEAGYGLKGTGSMMAYRFKLNKSPDTLRAVRIYFNHVLDTANIQQFYLSVWDDNAGLPGDTIYSRSVVTKYPDSINKFTEYRLENPVKVSSAFYVGTIQTTEDNLNIGLDTYNNASANLFYNVTGSWIKSSIVGSPLVRPVIGKPLPMGISDLIVQNGKIRIFPNPCAGGLIHISTGEPSQIPAGNLRFSIRSMTGKEVIYSEGKDIADVSSLPAGIYIVESLYSGQIRPAVGKLVIIR